VPAPSRAHSPTQRGSPESRCPCCQARRGTGSAAARCRRRAPGSAPAPATSRAWRCPAIGLGRAVARGPLGARAPCCAPPASMLPAGAGALRCGAAAKLFKNASSAVWRDPCCSYATRMPQQPPNPRSQRLFSLRTFVVYSDGAQIAAVARQVMGVTSTQCCPPRCPHAPRAGAGFPGVGRAMRTFNHVCTLWAYPRFATPPAERRARPPCDGGDWGGVCPACPLIPDGGGCCQHAQQEWPQLWVD
jgi:hypothetical protein